MKTLLVIGAGAETVPGIQLAKNKGLFVVASDINPSAPGFEYADDQLIVSTYNHEETIRAAAEYNNKIRPIDGVICIASDVPYTVARVAECLGLPGISVESASYAMDKLAMKVKFEEAGLPIPWYCQIENLDHLIDLIRKKGFPLVLKPVDSRGARGVLRLNKGTDIEWAYNYSKKQSPTQRVMVEEFLSGPQFSTESVIIEDVGYTPGFSERNYEYLKLFSPYIIENGGQQPTALSHENREKISDLTVAAGRAIGISTGTVKGDMVLTEDGPKIIEIAARLSGGWFCTDQIPLGTGVDFVGIAIRLALGETVSKDEIVPRYHKGVAIRYFFPKSGRVTHICGAEQFNDLIWVHRLGFFVALGDVITQATDHTRRAGFVITIGENREQAVERAELVCKRIQIKTESV